MEATREIWNEDDDVSFQRSAVEHVLDAMGGPIAALDALDRCCSMRVGSRSRRFAVVLHQVATAIVAEQSSSSSVVVPPQHHPEESVRIHTTRGKVRRWFYHFALYGDTPAEARQHHNQQRKNHQHHHWRRRCCRRQYSNVWTDAGNTGPWTDHDTAVLQELVNEEPDLFLDEIQTKVFETTRRLWSQSYLWRRLQDKCHFSFADTVKKAMEQDLDERAAYRECLENIICRTEQLLYLDTTAQGRNATRRRRSQWRRGTSYVRDSNVEGDHGTRYTLLAACDAKGFVFDACHIVHREHPSTDSDDDNRTEAAPFVVDRNRVKSWMEHKVIPILGKLEDLEDHSIVILDHTSLPHAQDIVQTLVESVGAKVVYLPPYARDLNPLDAMVHLYNDYLHAHRHDQDNWVDKHIDALLSVDASAALRCFRQSNVPLLDDHPNEIVQSSNDDDDNAILQAAMVAVVAAVVDLETN